ncbi:hypothetical protein HNQ80_005165 [Anaerosolibacter carboniphilus]|uniref:Uncharacterized protein n=1 Tax=Anaerosolibacter carboniphilus TaxID=1417629 RepID=A0A841L047_9FIRM|nr:hypothetical protein [Anaerosolibacter carboniphilus]MBB6218987.1 hypothetical protein [Anaerosolibacter carboniphilus]
MKICRMMGHKIGSVGTPIGRRGWSHYQAERTCNARPYDYVASLFIVY